MALYAVKGNKHLKITEAERAAHLALGYDIAEADGKRLKIVEESPARTVPFPKYKALLGKVSALEGENKALRAELTALRKKKEGGR